MQAFHFGAPERKLFGLYHEAEAGVRKGAGVLLCLPFGHEAIRIHRLYRILAERLCRTGFDVLRFDYYGTGDSLGEDVDGDMDGWSGDVLAAHAELRRRSRAGAITWLGARLGAAIAVRALPRAIPPVTRLVAWDPVVDGAAYLDLLRVKHVEALELSYCIPDPAWRRAVGERESAFVDEAVGFETSEDLRRQLQRLGPATLPVPAGARVTVLSPGNDKTERHWLDGARAGGGVVQSITLHHSLVWTSDPQPNSAMVPNEAVSRLLEELDAPHG